MSDINIKRSVCEYRARYIENVSYSVQLFLQVGAKYAGRSTVCFDLKDEFMKLEAENQNGLEIDFRCKSISGLTVNGSVYKDPMSQYNGSAVHLNANELSERNVIEITYESEYGNKGCGLHKYRDPGDGKNYLYTQFESPYCHTVMPVFEQPDLKAPLSLVTYTHPSWTVIANYNVLERTTVNTPEWVPRDLSLPEANRTAFYTTPPLSCYLYALCAGDYVEFKADPSKFPEAPPMSVFVRDSFKKYINDDYLDMWFKCSEHSISWYGKFMGVPYPYSKLDQIFCPEYNWGAMENVGCITYIENCLFKQKPSTTKLIAVCNVILHEIAHQWFGNLITMTWWDDLWLNEAFATYMSSWAQESFKDHADHCWLPIVDRGIRAQQEDSRESTHPIACGNKCDDTQQSEIIFDGISYGKGSMFLRMLCKLIGPTAFQAGVRMYFSKYQYRNTKSDDLLYCFDHCADIGPGKTLEWCSSWLVNQGVIRLNYDVVPRDGEQYMDIEMTFEDHADKVRKLVPLNIDLYDASGRMSTIELVLDPVEKQSVKLEGAAVQCGLLNAGVHAYVRCVPSESVTRFFVDNYHKLASLEDRLMILKTVELQAKEGKITVELYRKLFMTSWRNDTSLYVRECGVQDFLAFIKKYLPTKYRLECYEWCHSLFIEGFKKYPESHTQIVDYMISVIGGDRLTQWGLDTIKSRKVSYGGLTYNVTDAQCRDILPRLCRNIDIVPENMVNELIKSVVDSTDGDYASTVLRCQSARPDVENKKKIFQELISPGADLSQSVYGDKCAFFMDPLRPELMTPYVEQYYTAVPALFTNHSHFLARVFLHGACPSNIILDISAPDRIEKIIKCTDNQFLSKHGYALIDIINKQLKVAKRLEQDDLKWSYVAP